MTCGARARRTSVPPDDLQHYSSCSPPQPPTRCRRWTGFDPATAVASTRRTPPPKYAVRRTPLRRPRTDVGSQKGTAMSNSHRVEVRVSGWLADHWAGHFDGLDFQKKQETSLAADRERERAARLAVTREVKRACFECEVLREFLSQHLPPLPPPPAATASFLPPASPVPPPPARRRAARCRRSRGR